MMRTRISHKFIALSVVSPIIGAAFLVVFFKMSSGSSLSRTTSEEPVDKTEDAIDNSSAKPLERNDRAPWSTLKDRYSDGGISQIAGELESDGASIKKLEAGRHRVARVSKWLAPIERAVLVHSELEAANIQTGHSLSELGLPVSESTIMAFIENVEAMLEDESQDIKERIRGLRSQYYGPTNAKIIEKPIEFRFTGETSEPLLE